MALVIVPGNPGAVRALAAELGVLQGDVERSRDRLDGVARGLVPSDWTGDAADAFTASWRRGDGSVDAVERFLDELARTMTFLADGLATAQRLADDARRVAAAACIALDAEGNLLPLPPGQPPDPVYLAQRTRIQELVTAARSLAESTWRGTESALRTLLAISTPPNALGPATRTGDGEESPGLERAKKEMENLERFRYVYTSPEGVKNQAARELKLIRAEIVTVKRGKRSAQVAHDRELFQTLKDRLKLELNPERAAVDKSFRDAEKVAEDFRFGPILSKPVSDLPDLGAALEDVKYMERVPVLGAAATVAVSALDIANGEDPLTVTTSNVAGYVATDVVFDAMAGALILSGSVTLAPVIAIGAISIVAGIGVSWTVKEIMDHGVTDKVEDVAGDLVRAGATITKDVGKEVGHVWHSLFG